MEIGYARPLVRAWARMKLTLLAPFDLTKWLVLAFSAWLAGLADGVGGGAPGGRLSPREGVSVMHGIESARDWLLHHPWLVPLIAFAVVVAAVLIVLLLWISSRGKFIFLDNVVNNRARIVEPWQRYRRLGNSLFAWRLGFAAVAFVVLAVLGGLVLLAAGGLDGFSFSSARGTVSIALAVLLLLLFIVAVAYVALFLDSFVVPVMARSDLTAVAAWRVLLPWFERYLGAFVLYGLFLFALAIGVGFLVVTVGLLTCCVGFLLLALPYVGTVILLPVLVAYRAFSLEFLAQFDPAFQFFPNTAAPDTPLV